MVKESKVCSGCGDETNDFYPVGKNGVRCVDCHEKALREPRDGRPIVWRDELKKRSPPKPKKSKK